MRRLLFIVVQLRRTLLLHHGYTMLPMYSSHYSRERRPLEFLQFIRKYKLGNSVPTTVIMLRIFLTIAISAATCQKSFSKLTLIKNYLRSSMSTLQILPYCLWATTDRWNKFWHCHWRICQQKGKKSYCVENCSFHFRNKDGPNVLHLFHYFSLYVFIFYFYLAVTYNVWVFWCVFKAYHIWACVCCNVIMVHKLVNIYSLQSFKSQSQCNTYFYGLRGRQTQGPPRKAHTLATPLLTTPPTTFSFPL